MGWSLVVRKAYLGDPVYQTEKGINPRGVLNATVWGEGPVDQLPFFELATSFISQIYCHVETGFKRLDEVYIFKTSENISRRYSGEFKGFPGTVSFLEFVLLSGHRPVPTSVTTFLGLCSLTGSFNAVLSKKSIGSFDIYWVRSDLLFTLMVSRFVKLS